VAITSYNSLLRTLEAQPPGGYFFFYGEEEYLREEAVMRVVSSHLDPATRDFNFDQLRGPDVDAEALASLLATPPLMAARRVVVIRDAQGLSAKARDVVERVVQATPADLVLILSAAIPAGSKAKFYSVLQKHACAVEFAAVDALDAPGWLMERAQLAHGRSLEPEAARVLVAGVGPGLGILTAELEKLAAFVQERTEITAADVRAVVGSIPRFDRWAWFELVGERDIDEARRQLPALLDSGETGVGLVIGMANHLLRVALVCAGGTGALEQELKPYQRWLAKRIAPQARKWTLDELDAALSELLRTDCLLKSASMTDRQAMEELLLRLRVLRLVRGTAA
jgi:DNA polymerase-3 subunit delta